MQKYSATNLSSCEASLQEKLHHLKLMTGQARIELGDIVSEDLYNEILAKLSQMRVSVEINDLKGIASGYFELDACMPILATATDHTSSNLLAKIQAILSLWAFDQDDRADALGVIPADTHKVIDDARKTLTQHFLPLFLQERDDDWDKPSNNLMILSSLLSPQDLWNNYVSKRHKILQWKTIPNQAHFNSVGIPFADKLDSLRNDFIRVQKYIMQDVMYLCYFFLPLFHPSNDTALLPGLSEPKTRSWIANHLHGLYFEYFLQTYIEPMLKTHESEQALKNTRVLYAALLDILANLGIGEKGVPAGLVSEVTSCVQYAAREVLFEPIIFCVQRSVPGSLKKVIEAPEVKAAKQAAKKTGYRSLVQTCLVPAPTGISNSKFGQYISTPLRSRNIAYTFESHYASFFDVNIPHDLEQLPSAHHQSFNQLQTAILSEFSAVISQHCADMAEHAADVPQSFPVLDLASFICGAISLKHTLTKIAAERAFLISSLPDTSDQKDGGLVHLVTPNMESFLHRMTYSQSQQKIELATSSDSIDYFSGAHHCQVLASIMGKLDSIIFAFTDQIIQVYSEEIRSNILSGIVTYHWEEQRDLSDLPEILWPKFDKTHPSIMSLNYFLQAISRDLFTNLPTSLAHHIFGHVVLQTALSSLSIYTELSPSRVNQAQFQIDIICLIMLFRSCSKFLHQQYQSKEATGVRSFLQTISVQLDNISLQLLCHLALMNMKQVDATQLFKGLAERKGINSDSVDDDVQKREQILNSVPFWSPPTLQPLPSQEEKDLIFDPFSTTLTFCGIVTNGESQSTDNESGFSSIQELGTIDLDWTSMASLCNSASFYVSISSSSSLCPAPTLSTDRIVHALKKRWVLRLQDFPRPTDQEAEQLSQFLRELHQFEERLSDKTK